MDNYATFPVNIKLNLPMKQLNFIPIALMCAFTVTSCSTYKHSYRVSDAPSKNVEVTSTVVDVVTDFERKVKATSDRATSSVQDAKSNAYFNAIQDNDIDVLVDPIYSIRVRRGLFKSSAKASVTGFAGEFVNPRSLQDSQQESYDAKLKALEQFLELKLIVNEDIKTTIIFGGDNGKSNTQTINTGTSLVEQFNSLYNGSATSGAGGSSSDPGAGSDESSGFMSKLLKK